MDVGGEFTIGGLLHMLPRGSNGHVRRPKTCTCCSYHSQAHMAPLRYGANHGFTCNIPGSKRQKSLDELGLTLVKGQEAESEMRAPLGLPGRSKVADMAKFTCLSIMELRTAQAAAQTWSADMYVSPVNDDYRAASSWKACAAAPAALSVRPL